MFNDNWFVFLLIVMMVFAADGDINCTETAVLMAILFALSMTAESKSRTQPSTSTSGLFGA